MSNGMHDDRHGAQVERTTLAWNRAAIAVSANGALLLRAGFVHDSVVVEAVGVVVTFVGFAVWALSLMRYSTITGQPVPHLFGRRSVGTLPLAVFVLVLSLIDLAVVVFAR
jgi:uncharacterized membrane protein YidH (DUF202 family)